MTIGGGEKKSHKPARRPLEGRKREIKEQTNIVTDINNASASPLENYSHGVTKKFIKSQTCQRSCGGKEINYACLVECNEEEK